MVYLVKDDVDQLHLERQISPKIQQTHLDICYQSQHHPFYHHKSCIAENGIELSCMPYPPDSGDSGVDFTRDSVSQLANSGTDYNGSDSNGRIMR